MGFKWQVGKARRHVINSAIDPADTKKRPTPGASILHAARWFPFNRCKLQRRARAEGNRASLSSEARRPPAELASLLPTATHSYGVSQKEVRRLDLFEGQPNNGNGVSRFCRILLYSVPAIGTPSSRLKPLKTRSKSEIRRPRLIDETRRRFRGETA